jgi:hypothetical protein
MPLAQELKLKEIANKYASKGKLHRKKGQSVQDAKNAFVYGTMRHEGWKPSREKR